jgi:hypothetical protein
VKQRPHPDVPSYEGANRLSKSIVSITVGAAVLASMSAVAAQAAGFGPTSPLVRLGGVWVRQAAGSRSKQLDLAGRT